MTAGVVSMAKRAPTYRDKILNQDLPVIAKAFGFTDMVSFHRFISDLPTPESQEEVLERGQA